MKLWGIYLLLFSFIAISIGDENEKKTEQTKSKKASIIVAPVNGGRCPEGTAKTKDNRCIQLPNRSCASLIFATYFSGC